ncbi:retrovirus-related pol polyprotein from transposon TNT 1-94 [Tanacetum coccineum]
MVTCWILNSMVTELSEAFLKMQECTCVVFDKFLERDSHLKLIQLLVKLNDEYESVRSQILAMDHLPNVNKAYYTRSSTNCGQNGHVFDQCFKRIGFDWYKGKKAKKGSRIATHVSSGLEELVSRETPFDLGIENEISGGVDQRLVAAVCSEMMKMFKGKGIADESSGPMKNYASTPSHAGIIYLTHPIMVYLPDGRSLKVTIVGEVALIPSLILSGVFYVPEFQLNLLTLPLERLLQLVKVLGVSISANLNVVNTKSCLDIQTFHDRLGHTSVSKLVYIPECKQFDVLIFHCESCMLSKQHKLPFPISTSIQSVPFALLHMDLWVPYKKPALNGAHYFFTIVDDRTRATWTYLVHRKDQISDLLDTFLAYVDNHFKAKPKYIRSDNGTEILNKSCALLFKAKRIIHQKAIAYTPQQNGVVERKHRHLLETARSLRIHANFPIKFWGECVLAATYLINKMPFWKTT